jgi:DNA-binding IclR family transcriptional regulator
MQMASKLHAILTRFREDRPSWRQVDLPRALEMSPSALSRSLASLVEHGFLRFDAETGAYRLGPTIVSLAGAAINEYDEFRHAYAELHALMSATGLGANLAVPDDGRLMYLFHLDGPLMKRGNTLIGRHIPLHATALGKALLAGYGHDAATAAIGSDPLPAYTVHTITEAARLAEVVAEARQRGYAIEREELALGRGCIAVPIRGRDGNAVAVMSLSGPKDDIQLDLEAERYAGLLLDAAERISGRLGYRATRSAPLPATPSGGT